MFKRVSQSSEAVVTFHFDGQEIKARQQDSIAAALLASGVVSLRRTAASGTPRAPYCMMGACYECLVQIEGIAVQACMSKVAEGLVVEKLNAESMPDERS